MSSKSRQRGRIASDVQTIQQKTFVQGSVVGAVNELGIEVEWHEWPAKQNRRAVEGATGDGDD
jgi:hypothetical protein